MNIFQRILGINWKTTLAGIAAILAVGGKAISDFKAKDFASAIADVQALLTDVAGIGIGVGLIVAKDGDTTGVGHDASKPNG